MSDVSDVKATALAEAVKAIGQMGIGFEPPELTAKRAAVFEVFLSAAADVDVKGTEDHEDRQHDEHGHDDDARSGVAEVEAAAAWRSGSHRVTVPEDILTETVKLLDAEGFQGAASRLLRCAVSEKR